MHLDTWTWLRQLAEVHTEHLNREVRWFKWLKTWHGFWSQTGLSISQTADLLGFTENGPKKRKYDSGSSLGENIFLLPELVLSGFLKCHQTSSNRAPLRCCVTGHSRHGCAAAVWSTWTKIFEEFLWIKAVLKANADPIWYWWDVPNKVSSVYCVVLTACFATAKCFKVLN